jgi:hypothetical protein
LIRLIRVMSLHPAEPSSFGPASPSSRFVVEACAAGFVVGVLSDMLDQQVRSP